MSLEARTSFQRATNPITDRYGLASSIRSGVLGGGHNLGEHLGKNLSHHQVIHAVNQVRTANNPLLDVGKAVLSSTGGNPRIVHQALTAVKHTLPVAPFDRRAIARSGIENQLKHSISAISKKS
tara:strand:+ start:404 stop:775 length:372 start_codon:yes stop_codon:yes gene_type:complete